MESQQKSSSLFQVYLRLRPQAGTSKGEQFLNVEETTEDEAPTHITLNPPNDRRRAIEKFAFTQVFEEDATQLDLFQGTKVLPLVEGVLAPHGGEGTDALLATLGVTGSGKTHTILGSRTQRGMTQLALDVLYRSIDTSIVDCRAFSGLESSIQSSDNSEANVYSAPAFLETVYSDLNGSSRAGSRAATPMIVRSQPPPQHICSLLDICQDIPGHFPSSPKSIRLVSKEDDMARVTLLSTPPQQRPKTPRTAQRPKLASQSSLKSHYMDTTSAAAARRRPKSALAKTDMKGEHVPPPTPRRLLQRQSVLPQTPDISNINVSTDPSAEYAIVISMYEVYNDRIFDLLTPPIKSNATKEYRRRPLLFKSTEASPDRKVVAGLRKIICGNLKEALMVLEAGLHERRVAGTGSNSVSSRSHGFFCVEVKKRRRGRSNSPWSSSALTIVDLAGSERARDAKTQGATLAEAGKINESLMYLGQCLQMQSDAANATRPNLVPFRQCKLTELLFSNSFPSPSLNQSAVHRRQPQKAVMIVTADPMGDFNATSQILRYSALAREITVPRIPSITSTILANANSSTLHPSNGHQNTSTLSSSPPLSSPLSHHRPFFQPSGQHRFFSPTMSPGSASPVPSDTERATMEIAALEIARMAEEIDCLRAELISVHEAKTEAEAHLTSFSDRVMEMEQEIREECYAEFEKRFELEVARFKATMQVEAERNTEHWDRKVEVLARGVGVVVTAPSDDSQMDMDGNAVEDEDKENVLIENLEQENERLRREVAVLKRELGNRSPTKRKPLGERDDVRSSKGEGGGLSSKMEGLRVSEDGNASPNKALRVNSQGSPTKKVRKLGNRKWDASADGDDLF